MLFLTYWCDYTCILIYLFITFLECNVCFLIYLFFGFYLFVDILQLCILRAKNFVMEIECSHFMICKIMFVHVNV